MKLVKTFENGWELIAIEYNESSPMENHLSGNEIAADDDNKCFYCWELFLVCYGSDSMINACRKYEVAQ